MKHLIQIKGESQIIEGTSDVTNFTSIGITDDKYYMDIDFGLGARHKCYVTFTDDMQHVHLEVLESGIDEYKPLDMTLKEFMTLILKGGY